MAKVPADLKKNKEIIVANMDARELLSGIIAVGLAIFILYFSYAFLHMRNLLFPAILSALIASPIILYGFLRIKGMYIEDYIRILINNKILANEKRINVSIYNEQKLSSIHNEIIRIYKVNEKDNVYDMYKYLVDEKILLLTEYFTYENQKYVFFRLDAKTLISERVRFYKNLRKDVKYRKENKKKKIFEIKDEIDIFNNKFNNIERIGIESFKENIDKIVKTSKDLVALHLFNIDTLINDIKNIEGKIIFINNENKVSIYLYVDETEKKILNDKLIEYFNVDKNSDIYNNLYLFNVKNTQNLYRKIKDIKDIF